MSARANTKSCRRRFHVTSATALAYLLCLTFAVFLHATTQAGDPEYKYALIVIPRLNDDYARVEAINEHGEIAGQAGVGFPAREATVWWRDRFHHLGTLGGRHSYAFDVNNGGEVVGWSNWPGGIYLDERWAFRWKNGEMQFLGTLGGEESIAYAINDAGVIVGYADIDPNNSGLWHAFMWFDGVMHDIGDSPPDGMRVAFDINANNVIVGYSWADELEAWVPTYWEEGVVTRLPPVGSATRGRAFGVNDQGQIVGSSGYYAVIWENGNVQRLSPGTWYDSASARAINNAGQVVGGLFRYEGEVDEAWMRDLDGSGHTINSLMPPATTFFAEEAMDINEYGQVAGWGYLFSEPGDTTGYILTPVDPEMELSDPVPGIAGQTNVFTITGAVPGAEVKLVYSNRGGGKLIPGCDALDAVLQVVRPILIDTQTADANGDVIFEVFVPDIARDRPGFMFQAADMDNCRESQLTTYQFE